MSLRSACGCATAHAVHGLVNHRQQAGDVDQGILPSTRMSAALCTDLASAPACRHCSTHAGRSNNVCQLGRIQLHPGAPRAGAGAGSVLPFASISDAM